MVNIVNYEGKANFFQTLTQPPESAFNAIAHEFWRNDQGSRILHNNNISVFDAGCGGGWLSRHLLDDWGKTAPENHAIRFLGVDNSYNMLEKFKSGMNATASQAVQSVDIDAKQHDIDSFLASCSESFNIILSCFLLQHLEDWRFTVDKMQCALTPGGLISFSEMTGDHAYFAGRFDNAPEMAIHDHEPARFRTHHIARRYYSLMAQNGFDPAKEQEISAADMAPVCDYLKQKGLHTLPCLSAVFNKDILFGDFLTGMGLLQDLNGEPGIFSVSLPKAPENYETAKYIRECLVQDMRNFMGDKPDKEILETILPLHNKYNLYSFTPS